MAPLLLENLCSYLRACHTRLGGFSMVDGRHRTASIYLGAPSPRASSTVARTDDANNKLLDSTSPRCLNISPFARAFSFAI